MLNGMSILGRWTGQGSPVCLLDVKALYDLAHVEKARARGRLKAFRRLLAKAEALDARYRRELACGLAARQGGQSNG